MTFRFLGVSFLFVLLYFTLGLKAYDIQIRHGQLFQAKAQFQLAAGTPLRGTIFITDNTGQGIPAAITHKTQTLYAVPKEIADSAEYAANVSNATGIAYGQLFSTFNKPNDSYELLLAKPTQKQIDDVSQLNLKGIYFGSRQTRSYPLGTLAAQVVGFTGEVASSPLLSGRYGTEEEFDSLLSGNNGTGDAQDVHLTIDQNIQAEGERIVGDLVTQAKAVAGSFIVQDPTTGKILAMGGTPTFDPNSYGTYPLKNFVNTSVEDIYEPGSVFKVITMSAGIDSGKITPDTTYVDTGSVTINGKTIHNWNLKTYGKITMAQVIENSLNVGAAWAEQQIGRDTFLSYVKKFGFDEKTGIDLPGEAIGSLRTLTTNAEDVNYATASFGQGISVTPIALIDAVSAIANGGALMRPYVNAASTPQVVRTVISSNTAKEVTKMMVAAVDDAKVAAIPGYSIAAKSGTAQVPDFIHGGYTTDVIDTYAGFGPATHPQFTILIRIDEPLGAPLSGLTVVPAFRQYAEFLINYLKIPPDRLTNQ